MHDALRNVLREPLVHFLALALLIFAANGVLNPQRDERPDRIEVSEARIEQLAGLFTKTWQRPPTPEELKGLIDDFVKDEISYREALALGLDKDDTVIRRRMRQKLEFFSNSDGLAEPTDTELQAYLDANAERYAFEPKISFTHVFFDPQRRSSTLSADVTTALAQLRAGASPGTANIGDATMLPQSAELADTRTIVRDFGSEFANALVIAETGQWTGPFSSSFGLHLVLVSERQLGQTATLDKVRAAVGRDLAEDRRKAREAKRFAEHLKKYQVVISQPANATPQRVEK